MQVGVTLQELDAPLAEEGDERAGVFLTNALTGWEPTVQKPLPFPELEEERDRAERVKQETPILVILGNPPYNGFAGMAVDEERELSEAYRTTRRVRRPEGQGLNDLYVRFFRMAERRIAEKTGQGVVCFISNYSWLDSLSCPGMRERYLEAFDTVRIDNLNGDKYRTGKVAPDGSPDPSIFSTPDDPVGIQVGTAVATLVRKLDHAPAANVEYRNLWGQAKLEALAESGETEPDALYDAVKPVLPLGLPFAPAAVSPGWFDWPTLSELCPISFPGVKTGRDPFVVDIEANRLQERLDDYFDATLSHDEIAGRYPTAMRNPREYDSRSVRDTLLAQGGPLARGVRRYAFRPFDYRWLYWEPRAKLVDRPRPEYQPHVFEGNPWLVFQKKARPDLSPPLVTSILGDLNQMNSGVYCVPCWLRDAAPVGTDSGQRPNLSPPARRYLERLNLTVEDVFHHVLAVLHDLSYNQQNADALRAEGPRIPLPCWRELSASVPSGRGASRTAPTSEQAQEAAQTLAASAARGRELACLLDPDTPVPGVTTGQLRPEIAAIAVPATTDGRNMTGDDFAVTAGWGHFGTGQAVMPGQGRAVERAYTQAEHEALLAPSPLEGEGRREADPTPSPLMGEGWGEGDQGVSPRDGAYAVHGSTGSPRTGEESSGLRVESGMPEIGAVLGDTTFDIYLNDRAYWRNVPAAVWRYKLGGYQVLKKWLSYRERNILGRALRPEEVQHFTDTARRIAAVLLVTQK